MRTPPERQQEAERNIALRIGTPAAVRAWAERYRVPLIGMDERGVAQSEQGADCG